MMNQHENSKQIASGALGVLFLAVFIDLLEFGIVIPLLPFWATSLGATPFIYGLLASTYSFMSFVFAPLWGRLSDNIGRRPVILAGLVGTILGFMLLLLSAMVFTDSLLMLFLARVIGGGFTAATLPTTQAYIADSTAEQDRAKGFGIIGAAFGLGFAFGPAIGGVLASFGGYAAPTIFAMGLAILNLLLAVRLLPESLPASVRAKRRHENIEQAILKLPSESVFSKIIGTPTISVPIVIFATISLAFSGMQTTLALFGQARFGLNESTAGVVFFVVGLIAIITQGGLIRPLSERVADTKLIVGGLFLLMLGFFGLSTIFSLNALLLWIVPLALGTSISNPTLGAFLSKNTPTEQSGTILGFNQGLGSFMRIIGPIMATILFEVDVAYPYLIGGLLLVLALGVALYLAKVNAEKFPESACLRCGITLQEGVAVCTKCKRQIDSKEQIEDRAIS